MTFHHTNFLTWGTEPSTGLDLNQNARQTKLDRAENNLDLKVWKTVNPPV